MSGAPPNIDKSIADLFLRCRICRCAVDYRLADELSQRTEGVIFEL